MAKDPKIRIQTVEKEPIPQDGGYGWVVLLASFLISFIIDGVMYSFSLFIDDITIHFGIVKSQTNILTCLYTGFLFLCGPIVAGLTNAFGVRPVVIGGAVTTAGCFVLSSYSPSIYVMYILYGVIGGIATGSCYIGSLIIVAQYFNEKKGMATGICMSGSGLGSLGMPLVIAFLLQAYDWQITFAACGAMILLCCIMGAFLKPCPTRLVAKNPDIEYEDLDVPAIIEPSIKEPSIKDISRQVSESASLSRRNSGLGKSTTSISIFQSRNNLTNNMPVYVTDESKTKTNNISGFTGSMISLGNFNQTLNMKTLQEEFVDQPQWQRIGQIALQILKDILNVKLLFQNAEFFFAVMCNFFCFLALFAPYIYIPEHAKKTGLTLDQGAKILSIIGFVNVPMRLGFGSFADRKIISAINLNTFAIAVAASSCWAISYLTSYRQQWIYGIVFASGTAGMNVLVNPYLMEIVGPAKFNNALGIINLFRGAACLIGPFASGLIAEASGNYLMAFYFSALMFSLGCLSSLICSLINKLKTLCKKKTKATEAEQDPLKSSKV